LDDEIGTREVLLGVAPIRLISIGGYLSVCLLGNREASYDIDCVLDPNLAAADDYVSELRAAISSVALEEGLDEQWLNWELQTFVSRPRRNDLFLESVEQGISLYSGPNLVVFAGRLDWALERKMRRVSYALERRQVKNVDLGDAAALIRYMVGRTHRPLSFGYVRGLNYNGFDVTPTDAALRAVARYYTETYGEVGLIE
jgi:hypothetical protein